MAIHFPKKIEDRLIASIKRFCGESLELDVGDLKAALFLDYCVKKIGPSIYNRAIADAQAVVHERVSELDGTCFEPEFDYWSKG